MSNFIIEKQPAEIIPTTMDFRLRLPVGESISLASSTFTIKEKDTGTDKTSEMLVGNIALSGTVLSAVVKGGTIGKIYVLTFLAVSDPAAYKFEDEIMLFVLEHPR